MFCEISVISLILTVGAPEPPTHYCHLTRKRPHNLNGKRKAWVHIWQLLQSRSKWPIRIHKGNV